MCSKPSLSSRLENSCSLDEVENGVSLLGAIIADEVPNTGGIKGSLRTTWKGIKSIKLVHLHHNVFSIRVSKEDVETLLNGGPRHVDNMRFNVVRWLPNLTANDVHFHKVSYWVQISGLTLEKLNPKNAEMIGSDIGEVVELEDSSQIDLALRTYLRVKVLIDARNPLPTGFWLPLDNNTSTRVGYAYEGLCNFCFKCGGLGITWRSASTLVLSIQMMRRKNGKTSGMGHG